MHNPNRTRCPFSGNPAERKLNKRGRKTAGDLAAVDSTQRPAPPSHLTAAQKKIWKRVVDALPVEWFRAETLDLLGEYCRQVTLSQKISKMIDKLPMDAPGVELERLVRLMEKTARMTVTLSTKMRLSQQSTFDRNKGKGGAIPADDPWQVVQ